MNNDLQRLLTYRHFYTDEQLARLVTALVAKGKCTEAEAAQILEADAI